MKRFICGLRLIAFIIEREIWMQLYTKRDKETCSLQTYVWIHVYQVLKWISNRTQLDTLKRDISIHLDNQKKNLPWSVNKKGNLRNKLEAIVAFLNIWFAHLDLIECDFLLIKSKKPLRMLILFDFKI